MPKSENRYGGLSLGKICIVLPVKPVMCSLMEIDIAAYAVVVDFH
jgi:hypothetical protein